MKSYFDIKGDGGSNVAAQVQAQEERLEERLRNVTHIVAIMSGKGGVGKSSVTVNLAAALQSSGHVVGVVDADINGASIVQMTGVSRKPEVGENGVNPAVARNGVQVMSIDLFLDEHTRIHYDSDILILRKDQFALQKHLDGWELYKAESGTLTSWQTGEFLTKTNDIWFARQDRPTFR